MWKTCWFYCFAFETGFSNRRTLSMLSFYWKGLFLSWEDMSREGWGFPRSMELTERYEHTESCHRVQQWLPRVTAQVTGSEVHGQGPGLSTEGERGTSHGPSVSQHSSVQPLLPQCWAMAGEERYTVFVVSVTWECVIYHAGKSFLAYLKSVSQAFSSDSDKLSLHSHSQRF